MKLGVIKNKGAAVITDNGYALLSNLGFTGSIEQLISAGPDAVTEIKNTCQNLVSLYRLRMKNLMHR